MSELGKRYYIRENVALLSFLLFLALREFYYKVMNVTHHFKVIILPGIADLRVFERVDKLLDMMTIGPYRYKLEKSFRCQVSNYFRLIPSNIAYLSFQADTYVLLFPFIYFF